MKTSLIILGALVAFGCGGSKGNNKIPTPEERLEEQLRKAEEQRHIEDASTESFHEAETVDEEESKFDEESASHEMRRAALNAVDCPNTFEKGQIKGYQPGKTVVTMIFENNGMVKDVSVASPYDGTNVGDCIVRAMGTVHVEMFKGPEVPKTWELELKEWAPPETKKP
jgi:hypothetical protein